MSPEITDTSKTSSKPLEFLPIRNKKLVHKESIDPNSLNELITQVNRPIAGMEHLELEQTRKQLRNHLQFFIHHPQGLIILEKMIKDLI